MINMMMLKIVQNLQTNYMEKKKNKKKKQLSYVNANIVCYI